MDCCQNVSAAGGLPSNCGKQDQDVSQFGLKLGTLDDMFSTHSSDGDVALEWLSTFVEDCLTSSGNCLPPEIPTNVQTTSTTTAACKVSKSLQSEGIQKDTPSPYLPRTVIPGKARSKRKRSFFTSWSHLLNQRDQTFVLTGSDPPLLQQAYWLADSELIKPVIEENKNSTGKTMAQKQDRTQAETVRRETLGCLEASNGQPRRCTHCLAQRTPQWRAGPLGPKTLCNACGVRYKSGRLLPEYRPAKSPTFVSYKHSNSHKKVMEMRMALLSSNS